MAVGSSAPPQFVVLLWQHFCYYKRHWVWLILTFLVPFAFIGAAFALIQAGYNGDLSTFLSPVHSAECWKETESPLSAGPLTAFVSTMIENERLGLGRGGGLGPQLCSNKAHTSFMYGHQESLSIPVRNYSERSILDQLLKGKIELVAPVHYLDSEDGTSGAVANNSSPTTQYPYPIYPPFMSCTCLSARQQKRNDFGFEADRNCVLMHHNIAFFPNTSKVANAVMSKLKERTGQHQSFFVGLLELAAARGNATLATPALDALVSAGAYYSDCPRPSPPAHRVLGFANRADFKAYTRSITQKTDTNSSDQGGGDVVTVVPDLWGSVEFDASSTAAQVSYNLIFDSGATAKQGAQLVWLQDLLDDAILRLKTGDNLVDSSKSTGLGYREVNSGCWAQPNSNNYAVLSFLFPLVVLFAFILPPINFLNQVLTEKELKLREYLYIMGVGNLRLKLSWITFYLIFVIPLCFIFSGILLAFPFGVYSRSNFGIIVITLMLYNLDSLAFCYMLASFLKTPKRTTLFIVFWKMVFWLIATFLYSGLQIYDVVLIHANLFSLLSPEVPMSIAVTYINAWEGRWIGAQWANLFVSPSYVDEYGGIGVAWLYLIGSTALYLLLAWYLEHVFPGEFGVRQPFYFPVQPSFWFPARFGAHFEAEDAETKADVEEPPHGLVPGIHIQHMTKQYTRDKVGVRDLTLSFYQNEVTAFLGQNGAGKSTTMNILVGLISPSSGDAHVLGLDIHKEMDKIRSNLGFVPQYDILYPSMTVDEHLQFYGWLKGLSKAQTKAWTRPHLTKLGMDHLLKNETTTLSGGQKRKLSILTAYIGDPKVVILDEPTSGVDPFSRRAIWEMVLAKRREATTLISTHFMEEADLLGERIAIISSGELVASGTPMYLKNRYGKGFRIIVARDPRGKKDDSIRHFFKEHITRCKLVSEIGNDMTFSFPSDVARSDAMPDFLRKLEKAQAALGISSYGLTEPTLEEVFFTSTEMSAKSVPTQPIPAADGIQLAERGSSVGDAESSGLTSEQIHYDKRNNSPAHIGSQIYAMIIKKILYTVFSPAAWILQIGLPVIFIMLLLLIGKSTQNITSGKRVNVGIWEDFRTNVLFFQSPDDSLNPYIKSAVSQGTPLRCPFGIDSFHCGATSSSSSVNSNLLKNPAPAKFGGSSAACPNGTNFLPYVHNPKALAQPKSDLTPSRDRVYRLPTNSSLRDWVVGVNSSTEVVMGGFQLLQMDTGRWEAFLKESEAELGKLSSNATAWVSALRKSTPTRYVNVWWRPNFRLAVSNTAANLLLGQISGTGKAFIRTSLERIGLISAQSSFFQELADGLSLYFSFIFLACCFAYGTFGIAVLIQDETSRGLKRMQMLLGCNPFVYWTVNFVFDIFLYMITVAVVLLFLGTINNSFSNSLGLLASIVIPYGFIAVTFTYLLSFVFKGSNGIIIFTIVSFIISMVLAAIVGIFGIVYTFCSKNGGGTDCKFSWAPIVSDILRIHPSYYIVDSLSLLSISLFFKEFLPGGVGGSDPIGDLTDFDMLGKRILTAVIAGLVYLAIVILLEYYDIRLSFGCLSVTMQNARNPLVVNDSDVLEEERRVLSQPNLQEPLVLREVSKTYPKMIIPAVAGVSIAVPEKQCFGLLGINGAGKSTLFKMLTGNLAPTSGSATLGGRDLFGSRGWGRLQGSSYCPQENTLFDALTVRQHLDMFARLRGIPGDARRRVTDCLIQETGLTTHVAKRASQLSGGNQRKLQFAIALLDYSKVIFLDEPTTGMDPGARRSSWAAIRRAISRGSAIVLTSHSMEECEALCDRLVIMVAGSFQCLGSVQYLKGKFGNQYNFKIKLGTSTDPDRVKAAIAEDFPEAKLSEEHATMLHYEIGAESLVLSSLFGRLSSLRSEEGVEDFTVNQTNLEHVFVKMAAVQEMIQNAVPTANGVPAAFPHTNFQQSPMMAGSPISNGGYPNAGFQGDATPASAPQYQAPPSDAQPGPYNGYGTMKPNASPPASLPRSSVPGASTSERAASESSASSTLAYDEIQSPDDADDADDDDDESAPQGTHF